MAAEPGETDAQDGGATSSLDHDASRRAFFRQFGKEAVTTLGQVAGMAGMVNRVSGSAAASLLGLTEPATGRPPRPPMRSGRGAALVTSGPLAPAGDHAFRNAYRISGPELVLLDQRLIPEKLEDVVARRGSDVAYYLRLGACRGGAAMAQVAAYGLALTAGEREAHPAAARDAELQRTQGALASARPSSRLPAWAMERMESVRAGLDEATDGAGVAAALRAEADAIATDLQAGHAAIATALAAWLVEPADRPLGVLLHGDPGALSGGLVGTGITALRTLRDEGRELRVFVTETRPFMDGARLASWELRQAGIEHKVIADSAVAWLFDRETIDVVLIGAEWIAANGDTGAVIGSRAIALQAVAMADDADRVRPRIVVCGHSATIDPLTPDGPAIPVELRPARDQAAYLAGLSIRVSDALVPAGDVIPAHAIAALVTEHGVLAPPSAQAIGMLLSSRAGRPPTSPD
jgi:methylthioribose-1-phosphate isomerase